MPTPSLIKAMMNSTDSEEQRVVMNAIVSTTAAIETSELLVHEQNKHGRAHRYTDKHTHTRTQTSTQTSTRTHAQRPTLLTVFRVCLRCCIENAVEGRLHVGGWRVKHANHALGEKLLENAQYQGLPLPSGLFKGSRFLDLSEVRSRLYRGYFFLKFTCL